ncbi:cadherin-like beta sandwich domain-containing protein [Peteryoungia ipomoeae]|uniref:cadherin-like beta sandwich domain-containing protein n=1 Tax=Peteryoungia ipomoeae TaxID=1210932 RepID=UPI0014562958|nr:cadherin-like beta sandwich domain-containing protein [Peteryoungia ipomoeae]
MSLSPAAGALPAGQVGLDYDQTITASNGTGDYSYTFSGTLPAGLNLDPATGQLTGEPTMAGTSTFTVTATDENGSFGSATYTVQINPSSTATLSNLVLSEGMLSPIFASGTTSYTASVGNAVTSLTVTPTLTNTYATVTVNGAPTTSGDVSDAIDLDVGSNVITVVVTAQDGVTTATYTVTVTRAASTIATLSNLTLSAGTLVPGFASGTTSYTASVGNAVTSLTVTPTVTDATATITVNSVSVTSGNASGAIALNVGSNVITVVVTAQDGVTTATYTVTVTRATSTIATLSNLTLSAGTLTPAFASGTTSYTASVGNAVTSLTVTPTVTDATATITVNSVAVASGNASDAINLDVGSNVITVVVTAQDGVTTGTYTVTVTRAASTIATLSNLTLSAGTLTPAFASGTTSYTASVGNAVTSLTVTPTVTDATATITVNSVSVTSGNASGAIALNVGSNVITVVVTAQDGVTTGTYTVTITRDAPVSTNASLSALVLSQGTLVPGFASGTTSYTASVGNAVTSLTVTPTLTDATATITVNSVAVTSGNASGAINLDVGSNVVTVVVTAQDGVTTGTYTVTVTRAAPLSTDASLSALVLSQGTLTPGFASGTNSYTASVGNAVTSLTVTPTATSLNATVTVNSVTVASGNASNAINLSVGSNTITVVVTAQDGVTTGTYTVTATRAAPLSTDASLSALVLSQGTLVPGFASGTTSYTASVGNAVTSLTVTPTVTDATATITVNSVAVASGNASGAINLNVGDNFITVVVTAQDGVTTGTYTVIVNRAAPAVSISLSPASGALAAGQVGAAYSQSIGASGGTSPYSYSVTGGTLPAGLGLNTGNGQLTGTPTTAGTATFTITATDASNATGSAAYSLQINPAPPTSVSLSPASGTLPEAMAGEDYSASITASGGTGPYLYSLISGTLPDGMVLNVSTGELRGPLDVGTEGGYSFTIEARDTNNVTATGAYSLVVSEREVTVTDKQVPVPPGSVPANVNLATGATGGPFLSAAVASVDPPNGGTAEIVNGEFAQAGPPGPLGLYLKFTPNPSYSGEVTVRFTLTSALGTSNLGSVVYILSYDPLAVAEEIDGLVHDFVRTRQNLISNMIEVPGLLQRRRMQAGGSPVDARMSPSADGVTFGFATSLAQIRAVEAGEGGDTSPFNIWMDATIATHNREDNDDRWGSFAMISAGADYLLTERALVGLSFHYDRMTDPAAEDADLTGNGWLAGPYASLELGRGVFWDSSLLYGGSSNEIETAFWDGEFETRRFLFDTSISGQWYLDPATTLTPKLRAVYFSETVDDYAVENENGDILSFDGFLEEQLRISLGAELARQYVLDNGLLLTPSLALTSGVSGLDGSGLFGSVGTGFALTDGGNWSLDAALRFNIEGDGETSGGARLGLTVRF